MSIDTLTSATTVQSYGIHDTGGHDEEDLLGSCAFAAYLLSYKHVKTIWLTLGGGVVGDATVRAPQTMTDVV